MLDVIVLIPDHCLSINIRYHENTRYYYFTDSRKLPRKDHNLRTLRTINCCNYVQSSFHSTSIIW